ncbi:MAG TPA: 3'(2'),5'-bisphosphate nucleotidase CysQ [Terriglobales bacterium]|nr:3'(2'),5'-bisphosphate nucleotidase CysQ [Terriglobales bacterium]
MVVSMCRAMQDASDHELAAVLATSAGHLLLRLRAEHARAKPAVRGAAGDRRSHAFLLQELGRLRPADVVLSEEGADDPARLDADRVWIVDPLDGTREFSEPERDDWAVHVALWQAGALTAGAVALPARGLTLATPAAALAPRCPGPPRIVLSRSRPPAFAETLRDRLAGELLTLGSAGVKVAAVVLGSADVYVHAGGQLEWDSAAPVAVALAAGLHASRLDGSPLRYNQTEPRVPDLLVCRPELAAPVLALLAGLT